MVHSVLNTSNTKPYFIGLELGEGMIYYHCASFLLPVCLVFSVAPFASTPTWTPPHHEALDSYISKIKNIASVNFLSGEARLDRLAAYVLPVPYTSRVC